MGNATAKPENQNADQVTDPIAKAVEAVEEEVVNSAIAANDTDTSNVPDSTGTADPDAQDEVVEEDEDSSGKIAEVMDRVVDRMEANSQTNATTSTSYIGSIVGYFYGGDTAPADEDEQDSDEDDSEYDNEDDDYEPPVVGCTVEGKEMRLRRDGTIDVDTSVPGTYFNEMYQKCKIIKLTNESCNHNGFQYTEGLNVDDNTFNHAEVCGPDGLYFCTERDSEDWFDYLENITYVWDVEIPDNARVCVYENKLKADKFILSNRRRLSEFIGDKIRYMIHTTGSTYEEIFAYIDRTLEYINDDYEALADQMVDLINIEPACYYAMPKYLKTDIVQAEAARLFDN